MSEKSFMQGANGTWAGEQLLRALKLNGTITPAALRTLDTLRKDEWKSFDEVLVEEAAIRLVGVADLIAAGLTVTVANAMGKTLHEFEKVTDMEPATVSLDGISQGDNDRQEFSLSAVPMPITHKDFFINLRTLMASRNRGEPLDTTQVRTSGRLVGESIESQLFIGGKTFAANPIYGYLDHPNRNTASFGAATWSAAARTGAEIMTDISTMVNALEADRMHGPYWLYVSRNMSMKLSEDYVTGYPKTIRNRILEVDGIQRVTVADQLTADNVVMVQATSDVVQMAIGEPIQTVQWDVQGGFRINFKAFAIQVPIVKSDASLRSGIVHMS